LPGGVAKPLTAEDATRFREVADEAVGFRVLHAGVFEKIVLENSSYVDLILSRRIHHHTYYMGLVDEENEVNFYDGMLRVVAPMARVGPSSSRAIPGSHQRARRAWSYMKFCYLKGLGWKGFFRGKRTAAYTVWRRWRG